VLLGSTPWLLTMKFRPQPWWALVVVSIVSIAYGVVVYRFFRERRLRAGVVAMGFGMAVFLVVVFTVFLPRAPYLRLSIEVADLLKQVGATQPGQVVMQDYKEPSLAFYQGGTIREWSDGSINPDILPVWTVTTRDVFNTASDEVKAKFDVVGSVRGLAIADRMRDVEVMVLKKKTGN
jgi:predicted permease